MSTEDLKKTLSQILNSVKDESIEMVKKQAACIATNVIIDTFVVPPIQKCVIANMISNFVLIAVIVLNQFIFSSKLLKIYYILSCASTFYGINKILSQIENIHPVLAMGVPYTLSGIRSYLNKINICIIIEFVGIFFDWGMDIYIYTVIGAITVHTIGINYSYLLVQYICSSANINTGLRYCIYLYIFENMIVIIIYALMNNNTY